MSRPHKTSLARKLRRNQTEAEKLIWLKLRSLRTQDIRFRRQHPIGTYVVDFVCLKDKLVVELDGGQYNETKHREDDECRTAWLHVQGYHVIRFWDNEVMTNVEGVITMIIAGCHIDLLREGRDLVNPAA